MEFETTTTVEIMPHEMVENVIEGDEQKEVIAELIAQMGFEDFLYCVQCACDDEAAEAQRQSESLDTVSIRNRQAMWKEFSALAMEFGHTVRNRVRA